MVSADTVRSDTTLMLREIAGCVEPGTSLKAVWNGLAAKVRLNHGQIKRYWYGEVVTVPAHHYLAVRSVWDRQRIINARLADAVDARAIGFADRRARLMEATRA